LTHPNPSLVPQLRDEDGQTIVEYALILGTVSLVLFAAFEITGIVDDFTTLVEHIHL
jgi:Flp pilus assembly pilin Flp